MPLRSLNKTSFEEELPYKSNLSQKGTAVENSKSPEVNYFSLQICRIIQETSTKAGK